MLSRRYACAVKGAGPLRVQVPPGNWFAPPGSNRSGGGGNETVGASGVEGHVGDLASMQAVTRVVCLESLYQLAGGSPVVVIAREPRSKLLMPLGDWGCESGVCLREGGARWQSVP